MNRLLLTCILLFSTALSFGEEATISAVRGQVEVQPPGGSWVPASVGMTLDKSSVVSTGFNSTAVLESELSTLTVKPLTRIRIDELARQQDTARTEVFLTVGRVRAEVRTAEGLRHDFKLRSPMSTAAVRGTILDCAVPKVKVIVGSVRYSNRQNQTRTVGGGEQSSTSGKGSPQSGEKGRASETNVRSRVVAGGTRAGEGPADSLGDLAGDNGEELFGAIVVTTY